MPELRWILLVAGLLFLAGLALWESRRKRRLPPQVEEPTQHRFREPTLGLPELRPREPSPELPIVEIDESMIGLRVDGVRIEEDLAAIDVPAAQAPSDPEVPEEVPVLAEAPAPPVIGPEDDVAAVAPEPFEPQLPAEPIVEWPPEGERKLVSLRIAAKAGERLQGRAVRLALGAEGFVHGKFSIFHKPGPDARVVVSVASLTQPGSFDLSTMDSHRYGGLGLFTVLPGHLPAQQMLDELLEAGRNLSERLGGVLQDERGAPLDAQRVASLRAAAEPGGAAAGDSAPSLGTAGPPP